MLMARTFMWGRACDKDSVRLDKKLCFLWDLFGDVMFSWRLLFRSITLQHKVSFLRLLCSQHRFEVEYLRYLKGHQAVPHDQRWCKFCLETGIQVVGDEKHILCDCPQFAGERAVLVEKSAKFSLRTITKEFLLTPWPLLGKTEFGSLMLRKIIKIPFWNQLG